MYIYANKMSELYDSCEIDPLIDLDALRSEIVQDLTAKNLCNKR